MEHPRISSAPWWFRSLDRLAPTRNAKVALIAVPLGALLILGVAVRLLAWLNYSETPPAQKWADVHSAVFRRSLVGLSETDVFARFGQPPVRYPGGFSYPTGTRTGRVFGTSHDEHVQFTVLQGAVAAVELTGPSGCVR